MTIPFDLQTFIVAAVVVFGAYVIFGISAFGAALFTVPILSHFMPLDLVLPMCVLLDVSAALSLGVRYSREADKSELKWTASPCWCRSRLPACGLATVSRPASRAPHCCGSSAFCC